ncbi:hypothetical protein AB8Z38_22900 [Bradyrhizobium sp. LLZ17]|uniref:Peptidase M41 domain-containing protein n=1 Tax=Bradyrhizobium sp. LLZ17 TaxID=3239388 RepID=A0AB39XC46_9BRAD
MTRPVQFRDDNLTPLREVALHEAAHTVIGCRFGLIPDYVTIVPDHECVGHVLWLPHIPCTREEWGARLYTAAAPAGLICLDGRSDWLSYGDSEHIERILPLCAPLTRDELYSDVDRLVHVELQTIFAVARALMRKKQITGQQVERVIRRVDHNAPAKRRATRKGVH